MTQVITARFEAITSTGVARLYGMHPKLYGVIVLGEQPSCTMTRAMMSMMSMAEYGHVLVQAQLQLIQNHQKSS